MNAFAAWSQLYANLYGSRRDGLHSKAKNLINLILNNDDRVLYERSQKLSAITGGPVSVLPPDTRHVDYEIIPLIIADGLRGRHVVEVEIDGKYINKAKIAGEIFNAHSMVVLSHFTGHELFGFGGTLKNVGMGCASPAGS